MLLIALCCLVVTALIAGCGPIVSYERAVVASAPAAGGAAGEGTPTPSPTQSVAPVAEPTTSRAARNTSTPSTTRTSQARQRSVRTTQTPATAPPQRATNGRCDWMVNFERGKAGRPAEWIILDTGAWGRAEVPGNRIWIAPRTPCDKVYSVAVHEWTHHMQGHVYRDWPEVERELAPYGGPEMVADCGALLLGATWIKYGCPGRLATDAAAAILRGERPEFRSRHD